jgi:inorganic pyrophosphatase
MGTKRGSAGWATLKPFADDGELNVVVETPMGSRNKFTFDPEECVFKLHKVLPAGAVFPYAFGYIPGTQAPDGDPKVRRHRADVDCQMLIERFRTF